MPPVTWVDGVTPLNAVNMSTLESLANKGVANGYASLDSLANLALSVTQQITWAGDTNLYRAAADTLKTDDHLQVGGTLDIGSAAWIRGGLTVVGGYFYPGANMAGQHPLDYAGSAEGAAIGWNFSSGNGEVNLWSTYTGSTVSFDFRQMTGVGTSKTVAAITPGGLLSLPIPGSSAGLLFGGDTNLYRSQANYLGTTGGFMAAQGTASQITLGADGKITWSNAYDTNLYRGGANSLQTDGHFTVGGTIYGAGEIWATSDVLVLGSSGYVAAAYGAAGQTRIGPDGANRASIQFGGDASLFRAAADVLATGVYLQALGLISTPPSTGAWANWIGVSGEPNVRFVQFGSGQLNWGDGVAGVDTNLYRRAANELKTDGYFDVGQRLYTGQATPAQIEVGNFGGRPNIRFSGDSGNVFDTSLYRDEAGALRTNGYFRVDSAIYSKYGQSEGQVALGTLGDGRAAIYFGTALNTALYRLSDGNLATDGGLYVRGLVVDKDQTGQPFYLGGQSDTYMYRAGSQRIAMNSRLIMQIDGHSVEHTGALWGAPSGGAAGGAVNSLQVWVDGVAYKIALYNP